MNTGIRLRSARSCCWMSGRSPSTRSAALSSLAVVSWPGAEQEGRGADDVDHLGGGPVGVQRGRQPGQDVVAGVLPPVLDVVAELLVGPLQRVGRDRLVVEPADVRARPLRPEGLAELLVVLLGHAEQVGDGQQGERPAVGGQELALAVGDELVDVTVGEPPHEVLVLLEPLWGQQPTQQGTRVGVVRRVHRHHVLVHRDLGTVLDEQRRDVVALGGERDRGERTRDRDAGRVVLGVLVDGVGGLPAGDGQHPVVDRAAGVALRPQMVEVRVRVGHERRVGEVVHRVEFCGHCCVPPGPER